MTRSEAREVLGIGDTYSPEEIRKAYRLKATAAHPDRPTGSDWWFRRLTEARDLLLAPETISDTSPHAPESTSHDASQDASERLHPLVREALEVLADEGSTATLERIIGCRAHPAQTAVRTFLSVLRGPKKKRKKK